MSYGHGSHSDDLFLDRGATRNDHGSRNRENSAGTRGITETERTPTRDHRDTTNEEPHTLSSMIKAASSHRCARCVAPALALVPGHLSTSPLPPIAPRTTYCPTSYYILLTGVGTPQPTPLAIRVPNVLGTPPRLGTHLSPSLKPSPVDQRSPWTRLAFEPAPETHFFPARTRQINDSHALSHCI